MRARVKAGWVGAMLLGGAVAGMGCSKSPDQPAGSHKGVSASRPAADGSPDEPLTAEPGTKVITMGVEGMRCGDCAAAITSKLQEMGGVRRVRVSLKKKTAWVMVEAGHGPQIGQVAKTIDSLGYRAKPAWPASASG